MDPASPIYFSGEDVADLAVDAGSQFSAWSGEDARTSEQRRRVDGLAGLIHGFSFFFCFLFDLPWRASNRLGKGSINRDLSTEVLACPPRLSSFARHR
jgi:hypothetical protein